MPIFRFFGKNSHFWESLTKKKGYFQGKTWIFQEFFVKFGNVDENPRFGPKNVDGLFFLVATLNIMWRVFSLGWHTFHEYS